MAAGGGREDKAQTEPRRGEGWFESHSSHQMLLGRVSLSQQKTESAIVIASNSIRRTCVDSILVLEFGSVERTLHIHRI